MSDGIIWLEGVEQPVPNRTWGRKALTVDSGSRYGLRVRIEYSEELEEHGFERIKNLAGETVEQLEKIASRSDPANPHFEYPR